MNEKQFLILKHLLEADSQVSIKDFPDKIKSHFTHSNLNEGSFSYEFNYTLLNKKWVETVNRNKQLFKISPLGIEELNEEIKKRDWGKTWRNDYPKTARAKQETESLKKPEVKEDLKEVFNEQSLLLNNLGEVV